jgi:hypothetical protein
MDKKIAITSDFGSVQRHAQEGGIIIEAAEKNKNGQIISERARAKYPSSLHWYYKKGTITEAMLEAGTIFAQVFEHAYASPSPQSALRNMIKVDVSRCGTSAHEFHEGARRKLNKCYDILTPLEGNVIRDVAGLDNRASGEKRVLALKTGLRALTVYFKIPAR